MSNGRGFSRKRRGSPGKSVRKNNNIAKAAYAADIQRQLAKMADKAGGMLTELNLANAEEVAPEDADA